jgi:malonate-semialdehyde dehydrogenase (acetylating) / methylmalonate-semialdehyde dehydrogenase
MATQEVTQVRLLDNYVGGRWTAARSTEQLDVTNPATGGVLARVPLSSAADLDAAVAAAREALPAWRAVSVIERGRRMFALRAGLDERREELARSVTTEMGKTIADARAEVARMIEMVEAACAVPTTMQGRIIEDVSRNVDAETVRQPVGVCAAIVPFNFPAMVPFWFLPFAIACGNTFVLKPSEQVPLTQQIAFEVLDSLELPPGVVNLVNGGREVVEGILDHPGIDAVSFVGSAPVARIVYERAAKTGKRVQALGGAKNHMVVMPDAVIDKTVPGIIGSAFGAAGQRCMAGSVVVCVGEAHDQLMPPLREATAALSVGDGADERTDVGPVISCAARDRIGAAIERGVADGATLAVDGRGPAGEGLDAEGAYLGPTILDSVDPDSEMVREEIFGPVLSIVHVDTLDDAIAVVNRSRFGNGTSIFTESGASVRRYRHEVEAGMVGVNIGVAAPVAFFPFSGWKDSFLGDLHAHGPDAVEFFTRKKTVTSRWFSSGQGSGAYFVER